MHKLEMSQDTEGPILSVLSRISTAPTSGTFPVDNSLIESDKNLIESDTDAEAVGSFLASRQTTDFRLNRRSESNWTCPVGKPTAATDSAVQLPQPHCTSLESQINSSIAHF